MKLTEKELKSILANFEADGLDESIIGKEIEIDRRAGKNHILGKIVNATKEIDCIFITVELNKSWSGKKKHRFQVFEKSQTRNWHFKCNSCNLRFLTKK